MSWDYLRPTDEIDDIPDEWVWERLRLRRDQLLSDCDWRMLSDVSNDKQAWSAYRDALRDLPQVTVDPRQAVWPTPPQV